MKRSVRKTYEEMKAKGLTDRNFKTTLRKLPKRLRSYADERKDKIMKMRLNDYIEEHKEAEKNRIKNKAKKFNFAQKNIPALEKKAGKILNIYNSGYSMGDMKHLLINGKEFKEVDNTEEYGNSSRYKANHGKVKVDLSKTDFLKIEFLEGVPTILQEPKKKITQAKWLRSSGRFSKYQVRWANGYITEIRGFIYHADTKERAKEIRTLTAKRLLEERKQQHEWNNAIRKVNENRSKALKTFVGVELARKLNFCEIGIKTFIEKHKLNADHGYNLKYLETLEPSNPFISRLIEHKAMRMD